MSAAAVAIEADELPPEAYASALAGLPGMGPARLAAVIGAMSPAAAWAKARRGGPWREPPVVAALGPRAAGVVAGWRAAAAAIDVRAGWRRALSVGLGVALHGQPGYPPALADDIEPPIVLFHQGSLDVLDDAPRVAIVGTRRCTATGAGMAFELGRDLAAAGVVVVSGLALGIDGAAHRGALAARLAPPVGVVASGLDVVYPASQRELWATVIDVGLLVTEAPLGTRPERWRFPARNRIMAGLADLVVVVESHRRGGSLHTVDEADRRGIDVMAVPGSVRSAASVGVNDLLAEGRTPVRDVDDVLLALGLGAASRRQPVERRPAPTADDQPVLEAVGWQPASLDEIALRTGLSIVELASALDRLCASGWVERDGGWYERIARDAS
ncbi:MAG TPA: DNA-processing protein DprA [Acidimicrobiales bacterium]|jgi:DNA processing protein